MGPVFDLQREALDHSISETLDTYFNGYLFNKLYITFNIDQSNGLETINLIVLMVCLVELCLSLGANTNAMYVKSNGVAGWVSKTITLLHKICFVYH